MPATEIVKLLDEQGGVHDTTDFEDYRSVARSSTGQTPAVAVRSISSSSTISILSSARTHNHGGALRAAMACTLYKTYCAFDGSRSRLISRWV
jgi:hypothetical protein